MRKAVIGALAVVLGVPAAMVGDRIVSGAPAEVSAPMASVVVLGGFVMFLLSDHHVALYCDACVSRNLVTRLVEDRNPCRVNGCGCDWRDYIAQWDTFRARSRLVKTDYHHRI